MIEIKSRLQKWGNSFGIVVPVRIVKEKMIEEGEEVNVLLFKENSKNVLEETFGTLKTKKSTEEIMEEIDKDLDSNF